MPRVLLFLSFASLASFAIPAAQEPARQTFRASTRLVTVDTLVHGKDGEPIRNLQANDFRLFEDGKKQRIEFFSVVASAPVQSGTSTPAASVPPQAPGFFTNRPGGSPTTATVVLFDRLNSRFEDQVPARAEVIRFLSTIGPDDRVALYVLESNELRVIHDFTRDSTSLIESLKRTPASTSIEQRTTDEPAPQLAPTGIASVDAEMQAWLDETTREVAAEYTRRRVQITLSAVEAIATHLSGLPGRKNLVWISAAFPLVISDLLGPQSFSRELTHTVRAVNTSNLSIYPIDIRGLVAPFTGPSATATYQKTGRGGAPAAAAPVSAMVQPGIDTMTELAARTGGRAFFNTNGIGRALARALDDARVTYMLGYSPANDKWDGKFRKLRVTVGVPGAEVRHRTGYLALPAIAGDAQTMVEIARAPLEATRIGVSASFIAGEMTIRVDPGALTLRENGGSWDAAIDILIAETLRTGEVVKHIDKTVNLRLSREQRDDLMRDGLSLTRTVVRRSGTSRIDVVIRDAPSGAAGSIRIASR